MRWTRWLRIANSRARWVRNGISQRSGAIVGTNRRTPAAGGVRRTGLPANQPEPEGLPLLLQTAKEPVRLLVTDNQVPGACRRRCAGRVEIHLRNCRRIFPRVYWRLRLARTAQYRQNVPLPSWHRRSIAGAFFRAIQGGSLAAEISARRLRHRCQFPLADQALARVHSPCCTRRWSSPMSWFHHIPGSIRWRSTCFATNS